MFRIRLWIRWWQCDRAMAKLLRDYPYDNAETGLVELYYVLHRKMNLIDELLGRVTITKYKYWD